MKYMVDIDGTIMDTIGSDYENSKPYPDRIERINNLYKAGHTIIYWTARGANSGIDWEDFTNKQLIEHGCLFDELRMGKPSFDILIDDKSVNPLYYF